MPSLHHKTSFPHTPTNPSYPNPRPKPETNQPSRLSTQKHGQMGRASKSFFSSGRMLSRKPATQVSIAEAWDGTHLRTCQTRLSDCWAVRAAGYACSIWEGGCDTAISTSFVYRWVDSECTLQGFLSRSCDAKSLFIRQA